MRIIAAAGEFELPVGFAAELTRNNVLLTDAGEQTAPITLPGTPRNLKLVEWSDRIDAYYKPLTDLDVTVIDGLMNKKCNMGIHSADKMDGISATIYMETGDFYSRVDNTRLNWLGWPSFQSPDYWTQTLAQRVKYVIDFLKRVHFTPIYTDFFCVAPIATTQDYTWKKRRVTSYGTDGSTIYTNESISEKLILNGYETEKLTDTPIIEITMIKEEYLQGEFQHTIIENDVELLLPLGYGMTPFLKLKWMIEFIFSDLGYEVDTHIISERFYGFDSKMCVINNVADAICSGKIDFKQLVPDVSVKEFISEFEKIFSGKFIVDENSKKAIFISYKIQLTTAPDFELTKYLCSSPKLGNPEFTAIKINSTSTIDDTADSSVKSEIIEFNFASTVVVESSKSFISPTTLKYFYPVFKYNLIGISEIIHKNTSVAVGANTTANNDKSSNLIQIISVDSLSFQAYYAVNIEDVQFRVEYYPSGLINQHPFSPQNIDENDLYLEYINFRLNSNVPISAEMKIPLTITDQLKLHIPKILRGQPVMIESIKYALGKKGTQTVTLRTLREFVDR